MARWKHVTIARLELRNFKRFYGTQCIDLSPDPDGLKPLILIGGDNGRGKTSIHEAVNYALYEDDDLPGIATRPNYLRAVSDRLNRRALDEGRTDYAVAMELVVSGGDADRRLRIERSWDVSVTERRVVRPVLTVSENGRPIDWIDQDSPAALQDFLRGILPPRIAPFFFFDGERIQEFAEESQHGQRMTEAIEDILHINVYKTLRDDLKKYVVDYMQVHEVKRVDTGDFFAIQQDAERMESELENKRDRLDDIEREIEELRRQRKQAEEELRRIASPHASQRDDLILEQQRLEQELEEAKGEIHTGFEPLPILLAARLCGALERVLRTDQEAINTPEALAHLGRQVSAIEQRVFVTPEPPPPVDVSLSQAQVQFYRKLFRTVAEDVLGLGARDAGERLHDLGEGERRKILDRLQDVARRGTQLREAIDRRERLSNELRDIETKLQSTSEDPHVLELIQRNRGTDERIGALEQESKTLVGEIQRLEADLAIRRRQIEDRQQLRRATSEAERAIKLAQKARRVLDDFIRRLAPEKLSILRTRFDEMYGRLRKPEDPVRTVEIDSETWEVVLKDEKGRPLERRVFSAGMREMYALSLLWALARASGRELPILIDTPLGRLDSRNRASLCQNYFPSAGHQVIVLSTDKEVDQEWFAVLRPFVARQYRLDYDPTLDSTVVRPGYFF